MVKNSAINLDVTPGSDGFSIAGGTTPRKITVTSGDVSLSGSGGSNTFTMPSTSDTLVGRASTDTLTNKTIDGDDNTLQDIGIKSMKRVNFDSAYSDKTAATLGTRYINLIGGVLYFTGGWTANQAIDDSTVQICQLNLSAMGISTVTACYLTGYSDGGNAMCQIVVDTSGLISTIGMEPIGINSGDTFYCNFMLVVTAWL